jgi:hypothetical protein
MVLARYWIVDTRHDFVAKRADANTTANAKGQRDRIITTSYAQSSKIEERENKRKGRKEAQSKDTTARETTSR